MWLTFTLIAAVSAGISTTCIFMLVADIFARIEVDRDISDEARTLPVIFKIMLPLTPSVVKMIKGSSFDNTRNRTEEQLQMCGFDQAVSANEFIAIRILYMISGAAFMLLCMISGRGMLGILCFALLAIYPTAWIRTRIQKRHLEILKALPNILDLLTLSIEAGKDFMSAMRDILARRRRDALAEELDRTFKEIQLGKPRAKALKDLAQRVRQPDLTTVLNSIIQAEELGVSIGELLRIQGDLLRSKRFSRAEKLANEAPVKILLPMAIFIFPAVFIILMAPSLMHAMKIIFK